MRRITLLGQQQQGQGKRFVRLLKTLGGSSCELWTYQGFTCLKWEIAPKFNTVILTALAQMLPELCSFSPSSLTVHYSSASPWAQKCLGSDMAEQCGSCPSP